MTHPHHENPHRTPHLGPVPEPALPEPTEVRPVVGEIASDDPRFDLLAKLAETTFPELENMSPDDKVRLMFGGVGWRLLDPKGEIPDAKKEAITDWSANALVDVLPQGVLRDEKKLADTMAGAHPVLHEERRSHTEQARTDSLTGLGSHLALTGYSEAIEKPSGEHPQQPLVRRKAICYFDVNGMKNANDDLSDSAGDFLLQLGTNVFHRAQDELFTPSDLEGGGENGPKVFRKSGGADDFIAFVPIERAQEYVRFIQEEFGKMIGKEKDFVHLDENGNPTNLTPPEGLRVIHSYEKSDEFGLSNVVGSIGLSKDGKDVKASISAGISSVKDIEQPSDGDFTGTVDELVGIAFERMKANKNHIKESFPDLSFRED